MGSVVRGLGGRLVGAVLLLVLLPVLAAVALVVLFRVGRPLLFTHERVGRGERRFRMIKFRTMSNERDPETGELLPDAERLHPVGIWLRRMSLDELPQLWNIARGEMALVGPRPLPPAYLDRYTPAERRRHDVLPGITGWVQVNGRNDLGWDDRLMLDVWYVDHRSFRLDLRILLRTVGTVLHRGGTEVGVELPVHRIP